MFTNLLISRITVNRYYSWCVLIIYYYDIVRIWYLIVKSYHMSTILHTKYQGCQGYQSKMPEINPLIPLLPSPIPPFPFLACLPFPFPFLPLPSPPLELGPLKSSNGAWGSTMSSPSGVLVRRTSIAILFNIARLYCKPRKFMWWYQFWVATEEVKFWSG